MYAALIKFKGAEPPLSTEKRDVFVKKWEEVEKDPDWTQTVHFTAEDECELKELCKSGNSIIESDSD